MRIIISPAKKMRVDTDTFACEELPVFTDRTEILMGWIRKLSYDEQNKFLKWYQTSLLCWKRKSRF